MSKLSKANKKLTDSIADLICIVLSSIFRK